MSNTTAPARRLAIGVGNPLRGDDAAGLLVAARLRELAPADVGVLEIEGEPVDLIEAWSGAGSVSLADAVSSGAEPGTVHRVEAAESPLPASFGRTSTHALGLSEAVELARSLGRLPARLTVFGIEGNSFSVGAGVDPRVARAAVDVAGAIAAGLEAAPAGASRWEN